MADQLQGEAWHTEQRRKSQDMIRVFNPTDEDYVLIWDEGGSSARFTVPSQHKDIGWGPGQRVMQRYLARKFTKEIIDKIILGRQDAKLEQLKEKLEKQGATDIEYNANMQLMSTSGVRSDSKDLREPLEDMIWLGTEEEFGVDISTTPIVEQRPGSEKDPFERLENKKYEKLDKSKLMLETPPEKAPEPKMVEEVLPPFVPKKNKK